MRALEPDGRRGNHGKNSEMRRARQVDKNRLTLAVSLFCALSDCGCNEAGAVRANGFLAGSAGEFRT